LIYKLKREEDNHMTITAKVQKTFDNGKVKAICDVTLDGSFTVHGVKVIEGERGLFVSMPNTVYTDKNGDKKYQDVFHPVNADARKALIDTVTKAYEQIAQSQEEELPFGPQM